MKVMIDTQHLNRMVELKITNLYTEITRDIQCKIQYLLRKIVFPNYDH